MLRGNFLKFFLILQFAVLGCSGQLRVKSNPENAKVEMIHPHTQTAQTLGETPLVLQSEAISKIQTKGPYVIRVSKEGFAPQDLVFASLAGLQIDYSIDLKPYPLAQKTNALIDGLFNAQNLAQKGNYKESLQALDTLRIQYPDIAAISEMQGSIHMVRGEYAQAVKHLEHALSLDPNNNELRSLYDSAVKSQGGKVEPKGGQ